MYLLLSAAILISTESFRSLLEGLMAEGAAVLADNFFSIAIATVGLAAFIAFSRLLEGRPKEMEGREEGVSAASTGPQPRWEVLRFTNYGFVVIFVVSITYCAINYKRDAEGQARYLYPAVISACLSLAYIFGFFGMFFVSEEASRQAEGMALDSIWSRPRSPLQKHVRGCEAPLSQPGIRPSKDPLDKGCGMRDTPSTCSSVPFSSASLPLPSGPPSSLSDAELVALVQHGKLPLHALEKQLGDYERAVRVRRQVFEATAGVSLSGLPYEGYCYDQVYGANCEIVVGFLPLPVGLAGPLLLDGEPVYIPMATTEGCLVASTNRGCKALSQAGGAVSLVLKDGMTRAPCVRFPSAARAACVKRWIEEEERGREGENGRRRNYEKIVQAFNSTTRFGQMKELKVFQAGRTLHLRFACQTGDAMGMNMISKGCTAALDFLSQIFPDMEILSLSGNMCTDKKPSSLNWTEGRGKSIVVEASLPRAIVEKVLKTTVEAIVDLNIQKNLIGSALAGSIGGYNAHASNIVTAVFLALGQDPAQNVESSNCMTLMESRNGGEELYVSVTMPSVEVGTVGGGTSLPAQKSLLSLLGAAGASKVGEEAGTNARKVARVVGAAVLAGELSLMAALAAGHLVKSHMELNRKPAATT